MPLFKNIAGNNCPKITSFSVVLLFVDCTNPFRASASHSEKDSLSDLGRRFLASPSMTMARKKYFHRGPNRLSRPCLNLANRNLNRSTLLIKHNRRRIKVKVKFALEQATKAQRGSTDGVGGQCQAPAALPPGKTRYPLYWRLSGPQGRSGWARKVSLPPGFDPRTVQPVASGYID